MPTQDALQSILTEMGLALSPLRSINTPERGVEFFKKLGYTFAPGSFGGALPGLASQAGELVNAIRMLAEASGEGGVAAAIVNLLARLGATIDAIGDLHTQLQAGGGGALPHIGDLPRRLTDFLILDYFERQKAQLHDALLLLGLVDLVESPAPGEAMRQVNWDRLGKTFTDPASIAKDVYKWDTDFDTDKFLSRLERLMKSSGMPGGLYPQASTTKTILGNSSSTLKELRFPLFQKGFTAETYSQFGITFSPAEAQGGKKKGIALLPYLMGAAAFEFDVCSRGQLTFESTADIKGVGVVLRPPFDAEGILNLTGAFNASIAIREKPDVAEEIILIGSRGGTRLAMQGLGVKWFVGNPQGKLDVGMEAELKALRLVIAGGEGDGFLQQILSGLNIQAEAGFGLGYSLLGGFTFRGGAKLAIEISTHIDLGPLQINGMRFALEPTSDQLNLEAGAVFKFDLGPLKAVVENIGLKTALQFKQGNLGPANLDISFKPPNGVGLSLDAGVIKGGGYLFFDFDKEEYAGALELVFSGFINLKAIGLITTKMPDGSKGFSLLIIITAEFGTGLQLGFGFTLLGVGGLIGLNRTMLLQPLMEGVRTGAINSIMFPQDVVANAPRIISDLRAIFPPEEGKFLIGPMAKLGWGTPTLISLALGIIIEIPGNIAIVGVLKVALPTDALAILVLQVNFAGAIEFDKKRVYFFAALFESRVLFMTIEGEMGVLAAFGDDANFVVSVGGFHPRFNPPPLPFPVPRRISVNIANTPTARIRVEGYFAVTTNTAQFGAAAELVFGFDSFGVQGHIAFDALFQFSPFYFIIEISASVSLKAFGVGLFSIHLHFSLEGPTPWRARGEGSISLLFFDISADFDITWGESRDTALPPIAVVPLLKAEFDKLDNWKALPPASSNLLVTLRKDASAPESLVLHPIGSLRLSQKAVPLDLGIDKVGSQKPNDARRFTLNVVGGGFSKAKDSLESFAPAQFQNMDDAAKISRPAYEPMHAGVELSVQGQDLASAKTVKRIARYEQIIIDNNYKRFVRRFFQFFGGLFNHFLNGNAVAQSTLSKSYKEKLQPFEEKIKVSPDTYTVAFNHNNKSFGSQASFTSEAMARDFMQKQMSLNPDLSDSLHVIPQHEVNIAA
ncbi:MAG: hypothetical protein IPG76_19165 [Acidobacteria bacterium]|nr:hypothetical protein [Acidobacteriota bacterium]